MHTSVEYILSELVIRVADYFNFDPQDALAAVAQSKLANELTRDGNVRNMSIEQLSSEICNEIARGE